MVTKDLGMVTAYAYAVAGGYTGTEAEFTQLMADLAVVVDDFDNFSVNVTTLPAGSSATASYNDGVMSFGIPKGDTGARGATGETGATPQLSIGTVETTTEPSVTITGTAENPVLNFGLVKGDKGDTGEVSLADLSTLLPTDTAAGSIASFPDGQSVIPALSVVADIEPIQDLHGYDKPWSGGAGKNKWDFAHPQSTYRASVTENSDGTFYTAGTGAGATLSYLVPVVANQTYTIKISTTGDSGNVSILGYSTVYDGSDTSATKLLDNVSTKTEKTFTPTGSVVYIVFKVTGGNGAGSANVVEPMIEAGTTRTTYEPYSNICPISGHDKVNVYVSPTTSETDATVYNVSFGTAGTVYGGTLDVVSGVLTVDRANIDMGSLTWTYSNSFFRTDGITATVKRPPNNQTNVNAICSAYPIMTRNAISGTDTAIAVDTTGRMIVANPNITSLSDFQTAISGVQLCYELATPQAIQLTPQEVQTLLGQNNIWADTGDVEVTYKADVTKWVEKQLS